MSNDRMGRRENRRAFRPTLDGNLETRLLMAASAIRSQTAAGGEAVVITATDGTRFYVSVINGGTVRATPASGGRVNLIVAGSNSSTLLEVNLVVPIQTKGQAHTFNTANGIRSSRLNIASIMVTTGAIGSIEGYQTATLSGPITALGTSRIDRIALSSIMPGGSITTGGDLNTLDVYGNVTLSGGGAGISIGRDLNWFETFGSVDIANDTAFNIGRDLGNSGQPAKGSGLAGQGLNITGNLTVEPGSSINIVRRIPAPAGLVVNGNLSGVNGITVGGVSLLEYEDLVKPDIEFAPVNVLVNGQITL